MKTKILTKFHVYILICSHFTAISSICHFYSAFTVKLSFCEHRPSKNGHSFKSWYDKVIKFGQNVSNIWIWKVEKLCHQKHLHVEVIDNLLLGVYMVPPILGRVKDFEPFWPHHFHLIDLKPSKMLMLALFLQLHLQDMFCIRMCPIDHLGHNILDNMLD